MKKIISIFLCVIMILSAVALVSCTKKESEPKTLKLGLGVYTSVKASDATEDKNGQGQATVTAAVVLVDDEGKIVKCVIDTADNKVDYTFEGKAVANDSFKTKYELGDGYGMKAYGGSAKEWFEQVDAFCAVVSNKTLDEAKALLAEDGKGTEEVLNAGCTITISDFVYALEKAVANAVASDATADSTLKLGVSTAQSCKDAAEDANGQNQLETTIFAAAVDADGKIVAASSDCVQVKFTFDAAGVSTFDATKAVSTKKELGDNYGMKAYGGSAKEWFEQAAAFDAACLGKTVNEVTALLGEDNKGDADLQSAGCTILIDGFVKAAGKIG
ncbi:MAG: hypothetical protein IKT56_02280 [Clostridia bacterium]|nr:hypothetical protein [Clostridia bacterium]